MAKVAGFKMLLGLVLCAQIDSCAACRVRHAVPRYPHSSDEPQDGCRSPSTQQCPPCQLRHIFSATTFCGNTARAMLPPVYPRTFMRCAAALITLSLLSNTRRNSELLAVRDDCGQPRLDKETTPYASTGSASCK